MLFGAETRKEEIKMWSERDDSVRPTPRPWIELISQTPGGAWRPKTGVTEYPWPKFMHDNANTGFSSGPAPDTNHLLWKFNAGAWVFSSPAIKDGKAYVGSYTGKVYCLDAATGELLWTYRTGERILCSPAVAGGFVYIGSRDNYVYCLDQFTGELVWKYKTGDWTISSPAIVPGPEIVTGREYFGDKVYVGSADYLLYCLDATTGKELWRSKFDNVVFSGPAVANGKVYAGCHDLYLHCLNAETGETIWLSPKTGHPGIYSPSLINGRVYFGSSDHKIYCLDVETGRLLWTFLMGEHGAYAPALAYGNMYFCSGDHFLYCLDQVTGKLVWNYKTEGPLSMSPALADGKVYIGSTDTHVYCFDAKIGKIIWKYKIGDELRGFGIAIADGRLYVPSRDGHIFCFGKGPTLTSVSATESSLALGTSTIIYGRLADQSPASRGVPVVMVPIVLSYVRDGAWNDFAKVTTAQDGTFTHEWTPPEAGLFKVVARFEGNNSYEWSSCETMVRVKSSPHNRSLR
jgi:outer membrane protein assembly factor BamB